MLARRSLFGILAGAVAAPIVVRSGLMMPVKAPLVTWHTGTWTQYLPMSPLNADDVLASLEWLERSRSEIIRITGLDQLQAAA
jgi:hypothetical protein